MKRLLMLLLSVIAASVTTPVVAQPLPRDSVYQSTAQLTDDRSQRFAWNAKRGQPQIVSMFYTSCKFVCPLIIDTGLAIEQGLTADERSQLGMMLISFDPARDTPKALARVREERGLDPARWTLARPDPQDVRSIAALLGVRYRALADGEFNHSTVLVLLDADGRIVARSERAGGMPDPKFVAAVRKTLRPGAAQ